MVRAFVGAEPAELVSARNWREVLEKRVIRQENELRSAVAQGQEEIRKLETYCAGLSPDLHQLWGGRAREELSAIGKLIQRWNRQLSYLKVKEQRARDYQWHKDKTGEEKRVYIEAKRTAQVKGGEQVDALKMLRQANREIERAFSYAELIVSKAQVQIMPEAIPMDKVAVVVNKSQAILDGVRDRVPEADVRETTRKIDALRRYQAEMNRILTKLGYDKQVESYEEGKKSEGLSYFRAHIPPFVTEIVPVRDITGLESLASKGLSGAREAISKAIILAAKRNPEKVRAMLGG